MIRAAFVLLLTSILSLGQEWELLETEDGAIQARHEAEYVEVGGKFYLVGGRGDRELNIYDPDADTWTTGAKPPEQVHHFQGLAYEGELWLAGAFTGGYPAETPYPNFLIYSPERDEWRIGPRIERPRGAAGFVLHEGKMYLVCGILNGHIDGHVAWTDCFDPKTGEWTQLADAPRARDHFRSVVIDGQIFNAAGRRTTKDSKPHGPFGNCVAEVDVYDIAKKTWKTLPVESNLPTPRAGNMACNVEGKLVVAGGESPATAKAHDEVEVLDPASPFWITLPPLKQGRHGSGIIYYGGKMWIASGSGGRGGGPELTTQECCEVPF